MSWPSEQVWRRIDHRWVTMRRIQQALLWTVLIIAVTLTCFIAGAPGWLTASAGGAALLIGGYRVWVQERLWRTWGYAETADELFVRHGLLTRQTVVVPYGRMQTVDLAQGPLERRFGLARVKLVTASMGGTGQIEGLPLEAARDLVDRLGAQARERRWSL